MVLAATGARLLQGWAPVVLTAYNSQHGLSRLAVLSR